jgi:hypothetical protein
MSELKPIKLGYTSYETFVDAETMQQLEAIVAGNTYCQTCRKKFTDLRPEVSKNTCLGCFILRNSELENTGPVWPDNQDVPQYLFMDGRGHITLTSPDSPHKQEAVWATLKYWGFSWPNSVQVCQEHIPISPWRWHSLYSHPRKWAAIATYQPSHGAIVLAFLLQKDGSALYLDRRLKRVRDLLAQARADIVAGKAGEEGEEYGSRYDPSDYQIYRRVADLVSEHHDAQQQQRVS